ncbi:MAG: hypothetical protein A3I66_13810 [Burkholderiales bacterium RIFCSPLOWO2_02_FULL_57_36]|nr:MAG: hypothetical protein A3I66_13810 [Burkholderiales bacterium RIFCSPLOWO2_02_FULL_57_36]
MNTDDLVSLLAKSAGPVESDTVTRRFAIALGWGMFGSTLAMAITLGVRPDISDVLLLPMFWVKLMFPALVAIIALYAAIRLAQPGVRLGRAPAMLGALAAVVWALGMFALLNAAPAERRSMIFGDTWMDCLVGVPLLSIPVFIAAVWAMKGLAPTRLRLAGGAAGLLAGAVSATVYALHCPELEVPFIAIWYVIGMSIPAVAGALIGHRLLRW